MPPRLLDAILDALAVLAPVDCAGCGSADRGLCGDCRALLTADVTPRTLDGGDMVYTALRYEGAVRKAIIGLKEQGRTDIARPLSLPLAAALTARPRMRR